MNKSKFWIFLMISIGIGLIFYFLYQNYVSSIEYSLNQISRSIKENDLNRFKSFIDQKAIAEDLYSVLKSNGKFSETEDQFAKRFNRLIRKTIEKGNLDELDTTNVKYLLTQSFEPEIVLWKSKIDSENITIGHIEKDGKVANIQIRVGQSRFDTILDFNIKMRNSGNLWEVYELTDYKFFAQILDSLELKRVRRINDSVSKIMFETKKIYALNTILKPQLYGSPKATTAVCIKDLSGKGIESLNSHISLVFGDGQRISKWINISDRYNIAPNDSVIFDVEFELYTMPKYLFELSHATSSITFGNEVSLRQVKFWENL